jgi:chaperonin GroEL
MENTTILGQEARKKIKEGVDLVANAVKVTLGAKGMNVICVRDMLMPVITKDGVSVAKEVSGNDPIINAGASMIKQVADETNEKAGDGTTSSTVLAQAIVEESFKLLEEGSNAISLQRGLLKGLSFCVKEIQKLANKKTNKKTITSVAHISSNGDREITKLVVDAIIKVGKNGTIKVEQTDKTESFVSVAEGYEIESPFVDAKFITNDKKYTSELENVNVLVFDGRIQDTKELFNAITLCSTQPEKEDELPVFKGLLVIAQSVSPDVQLAIAEYHRLGHHFMNINAPSFGMRRAETLKDIATVIGARYLNQDLGDRLEKITLEDLGFVEKVTADANKTVLIGGKGDAERVKERVEVVTEQVKTVIGGKKEVIFVKDRLSKLKKGVAVINVGGFSKPERREKEDRIEDALCAIRATLEQGFVAGEGVTYINVAQALKSAQIEVKNKDEQKGIDVLIKALYAPFKQILVNAGLNPNDHLKEIEEGTYGMGVDLDEDTVINLFEQNIIDPTKVSIMALQNATSISSTFLSTGAITYNEASPFAMEVQ